MDDLISRLHQCEYLCSSLRGHLDDAGYTEGGSAHSKLAMIDAAVTEAADVLEAAKKDKARLDWLDSNAFTAYRAIDPIDGLAKHCVVVDESKKPRRGNTGTIRESIDSAREVRNEQ